VAIGYSAGNSSQADSAVAIGQAAGESNQLSGAVAIGTNAGNSSQGERAVAIGEEAGYTGQKGKAVAIGYQAGKTTQGSNSIAIGNSAGQSNQPENTIILNATGNVQNGAIGVSGAFYVDPIRGATGTSFLYYSAGTKEITYANPVGETGPYSLGYSLSTDQTGQTGGFKYTLIPNVIDTEYTYGGMTGYNPTTGYFFNPEPNPMSVLVDWQVSAEQGNWDIDFYKGNTGIWKYQMLASSTDNSFSQTVVLNQNENCHVEYTISGPETYTLHKDATRIQFTRLDKATGAKTFIIDHPSEEDKYLVHACLEGPEVGVYYRGKAIIGESEEVEIKLPEYVSEFAQDFTVSLTPIHMKGQRRTSLLEASEVNNGVFTVYGSPGPFHWVVFGKRGNVVVEPYKSQVEVKGDGPYRYI
jgi:hypothetical protein